MKYTIITIALILIVSCLVYGTYLKLNELYYEFKESELKYRLFFNEYEEELDLWERGILTRDSKIRTSSYFSTDELINAFTEIKDIGLLDRYNKVEEKANAYKSKYGILIFIMIISFLTMFITSREWK